MSDASLSPPGEQSASSDDTALWVNAHLATMATRAGYGEVRDGAMAVCNGVIEWLGPRTDVPQAFRNGVVEHDCGGRWITPGLIDCHTHLVYAGDRANEFEQRLNGVSYEAIAREGGGILSTVRATRAASESTLIEASLPRLRALLDEGVTTIEIKSGYGLDLETEARMLRAARRLGEICDVTVCTTYLGAHALPPEYRDRRDEYIAMVCDEVLPALCAERLVDAVDAFCDTIGFTAAETERVLSAARKLALPVKLHAEQLSDQGGAALAARYGALSADHLEHVSETSIEAMARANTTAVLLPAAFYFLRDTQVPPVQQLRDANVPIALASDCNPGTSPTTSLLLVLNMACTLFRLTPAEALAGVTRHAARALGFGDRGILAAGHVADFVLWNVEAPGELCYRLGFNPRHAVVRAGHLRANSAH